MKILPMKVGSNNSYVTFFLHASELAMPSQGLVLGNLPSWCVLPIEAPMTVDLGWSSWERERERERDSVGLEMREEGKRANGVLGHVTLSHFESNLSDFPFNPTFQVPSHLNP